MYGWTHTHTRTYKLRWLSTRCIKKWNLFFDRPFQFEIWQHCRHLPLCRSSCAIRACRMPHLQFIYKIYHTAHTANAAYVRSMYTPRRPSVCVCMCAYDKGVDYMTASFVFIISFAHCAYQHFKHLFSVVPGLLCPPSSVLSSTNYS